MSSLSFAQQYSSTREYNYRTKNNEIKVMTYNLLNLFDTYHDEGFQDFTFLPAFHALKENCHGLPIPYYRELCLAVDWTPDRLQAKIEQIGRVIQAQGELPDILAVQEIENQQVIRMLSRYLGYDRYIVTNSPSRRGIDVALLYRERKLQLKDWKQVPIVDPNDPDFLTRPILEAQFYVNGADKGHVLGVYVNHWPSQSATTYHRQLAAQSLAERIEYQMQDQGYLNYHVVALGDFNTTTSERPNAIADILHNSEWWNALQDTQLLSHQFGRVEFGPEVAADLKGTYWYRGENTWNYFDRILISQNLANGKSMEYDPYSYLILFEDFMSKIENWKDNKSGRNFRVRAPFAFNFTANSMSEMGYSDHLPVIVKIRIR